MNATTAHCTTSAIRKPPGHADPCPFTTLFRSAFLTADGVSATYSRAAGETVAGGPYLITATLSATVANALANYNITNTGANFTISAKALTITAENKSKQYSDPLPQFTVQYSAFAPGEGPTNLTDTLSCGTTATAMTGPGSYPNSITCSGQTSSNYAISYKSGTLTVTQEDARVTYAGNMFVGIPLSSPSGPITLIATISDITAMGPYNAGSPVTGDTAYDPYPGDIRNATVTFVNREVAGNPPIALSCANLPVALLSSSDLKTGSVTCTFTGTVQTTSGSTQYTVGIVVSGYYTRNASTDDTVVTLSQVGAGMITGGGYKVLQNSAGTIAGDQGKKNNFGFNVKYNKAGTNLQGKVNAIVRRNGSVYQIKGNSMTSLAVYQLVNDVWVAGCTGATSTSPCKAQFNGNANIQDITNPLVAPVAVPNSGGSALQFNMTDYGTPGSSDTIGITLWNGSGGIWFSTNWVGTPPATVEQPLGGGNLEVH